MLYKEWLLSSKSEIKIGRNFSPSTFGYKSPSLGFFPSLRESLLRMYAEKIKEGEK